MTTVTTRRPAYRANLATVEGDLAAAAARLRALVAPQAGPPTAATVRELALLHANVAHTFASLEGSQRFVDYQHLMHWQGAFFDDPVQVAATERALDAAEPFADPDAEDLRRTWRAWFGERSALSAARRRQTELEAGMRGVLRQLDAHQLAFVQRLGIDTSGAGPSVLLAATASRIANPATRTKLTTAWRRHVAPDLDALTDLLDEAVAVRRADAAAAGWPSVRARTFARCTVDEQEAAAFLREFLVRALESQRELESAVRAATGAGTDPMDHFGRYVRLRTGDARLPTFRLEAVLDLLCELARRVLGVTVAPVAEHPAHALTLRVARDGAELGTIDVDLLHPGDPDGPDGPARAADPAQAATAAKAHVLCLLHPGPGDGLHVTFPAAQTVFHEFGHALTHVLVRRRLPSASGVEHVPLERLECASTWWERWACHPDFAAALDPTGDAAEALAHARRLRALETWSTTLQCTVAAAVDLDVHGRADGGHREAYDRLDREFGLADHCTFADLPGYLTHLTWQAAPGAGFLYAWGAATSAAAFAPYWRMRIADLPVPGLPDEPAGAWLDVSAPSPRPPVDAYFAFLRDVLDTGSREVVPA
ncbi:MAG: M3 family metallopeptidase [Pseudonocardiaceae bacterium]